jgi:amphiphysin
MTNAAYSLLPPLLNAQIMIQNTLLGQLYTTLHNFSQDHGFPSPPPEMEEIVAIFESDFTSLRLEAESGIKMLAQGKAIHQPMALNESHSYSRMHIRERTTGAINSRRGISNGPKPAAIMPSPSSPSTPPSLDNSSKPRLISNGSWRDRQGGGMLSPDDARSTADSSPPASVYSNNEYFAINPEASSRQQLQIRQRQPSTTSLASSYSASSIAAKKKPPPPPPKRLNTEYVTALYDFRGEGPGDLSFKEGDKIRIVKKTTSDQDWWDGELRGVKGAFPANYTQKC